MKHSICKSEHTLVPWTMFRTPPGKPASIANSASIIEAPAGSQQETKPQISKFPWKEWEYSISCNDSITILHNMQWDIEGWKISMSWWGLKNKRLMAPKTFPVAGVSTKATNYQHSWLEKERTYTSSHWDEKVRNHKLKFINHHLDLSLKASEQKYFHMWLQLGTSAAIQKLNNHRSSHSDRESKDEWGPSWELYNVQESGHDIGIRG